MAQTQRNPIMHCQEAYDGVVQTPMQMGGQTVMAKQQVPNTHYWLQMMGAVLKELPDGGTQWVTDYIGRTCARCMAEMDLTGNLRIINVQASEIPEDDKPESLLITP